MTKLSPAELASYEFNIRSFHPEKTFGWSGLFFEGDNRGFSLRPSGRNFPTSRVWQRFLLNTEPGSVSALVTRSDPSKAPWSGQSQYYSDEALLPSERVALEARKLPGSISQLRISGSYGGVNHAMYGSAIMQEKLGFSYVPTLDVSYEILVDVDRVNRHVDIVTYVKGDGFPNCEAFVVGPGQTPVFLGVHVRKGMPATTLALNANYPMIACAIRLPINRDGSFQGEVGDELARKKSGKKEIEYRSISDWNARFVSINPNSGHCMGLEQSDFEGLFSLECLL